MTMAVQLADGSVGEHVCYLVPSNLCEEITSLAEPFAFN